jgi:phage terminase small subunit
MILTPKQEAFAQAYIETGNASEAYRRAYRLTYLADWQGNPATNEWKRRTTKQIGEWRERQTETRKARKAWKAKQRAEREKQKANVTCASTVVSLVPLPKTGGAAS